MGPTVYSPYPRRLESQRQHFLLSYFKTLSVGPAGVELTTSRMVAKGSPMLNRLSHRCGAVGLLSAQVYKWVLLGGRGGISSRGE